MKTSFYVEGMECMGCVHRIENVLSNIEGVSSYHVDLEHKKVEVVGKEDLNIPLIIEKITNLGFQVTEKIV